MSEIKRKILWLYFKEELYKKQESQYVKNMVNVGTIGHVDHNYDVPSRRCANYKGKVIGSETDNHLFNCMPIR